MVGSNDAKNTNAATATPTGMPNNIFGSGILDTFAKTLTSYGNAALQVEAAKQLNRQSGGLLGWQIDPFNGISVVPTTTVGSAAPASWWKATDMFWIGGAAAIALLAIALKK